MAAVAMLPAASAGAVDIINEDPVSYVVFVMEGDASAEITIMPGETLSTVCHACELEIEDDKPLYAEGEVIVVIRNGKLMLRS